MSICGITIPTSYACPSPTTTTAPSCSRYSPWSHIIYHTCMHKDNMHQKWICNMCVHCATCIHASCVHPSCAHAPSAHISCVNASCILHASCILYICDICIMHIIYMRYMHHAYMHYAYMHHAFMHCVYMTHGYMHRRHGGGKGGCGHLCLGHTTWAPHGRRAPRLLVRCIFSCQC